MKRLTFALGLVLFVQTTTAQEKNAKSSGVTVDVVRRAVIVDAKVAPRKLPNLDKVRTRIFIPVWESPLMPRRTMIFI